MATSAIRMVGKPSSLHLVAPIHRRCRQRMSASVHAQLHGAARLFAAHGSMQAVKEPEATEQTPTTSSEVDSEQSPSSIVEAIKRDMESRGPSNSASPNTYSADQPSTALPNPSQIPPRLQQALKDAQVHLDRQYGNVRKQSEVLRRALAERAKVLGKEAEVRFNALGGQINEVTGYKEVEKLKDNVRERELEIARFREAAAKAKITYDEAVNTRDTTQRQVTSLLERKHQWSDSDVHQFTSLVRSDHSSNLAVAQTKVSRLEAEANVEKAFDEMMKAILERYHEEQVWSDKVRSVSTYGSLAVLAVNLIVFIGAILIVEPWKRKTLVTRLEEKVSGMMEKVEGHLARDLDSVKTLLAAIPLAQAQEGGSRTVDVPGVLRVSMVDNLNQGDSPDVRDLANRTGTSSANIGNLQDAEDAAEDIEATPTAGHPPQPEPSQLRRLVLRYVADPFRDYFPQLTKYIQANPRTIDAVLASTGGVLGGLAIASISMASS